VVSSSSPFINIPDYPDLNKVLAEIQRAARNVIVDAAQLAQEAGLAKAQNMVMLGVASNYLILDEKNLKKFIQVLFQSRGEKVVDINLKAFELGAKAAVSSQAI